MSFQAEKTIVLRSIPLLPEALQWSPGDMHLVAVTHSHLHLLTPSPCATQFAIVTLPPPILLAATSSETESRTRPLLPRDNRADSLVLPGDLLPSAWRLARWSPRAASGLGSLLAAVDYAGRLVFYAQVLARAGAGAAVGAAGGSLGGASDSWRLVQDWTPLVSHYLYLARRVRRSDMAPAARGVKVTPRDAMVVSIAWRPNLLNDHVNGKAVLAVGTVAGHVSVWICDMQSGHGEPVAMWHLAALSNDQDAGSDDDDSGDHAKQAQFTKPSTLPWVTLLSWSPTGDYLAYALSNGEFGVLQTTFTPPESVPDSDTSSPTWSITAQPQGRLFAANDPSQHDPRTCTAITWCSPTHVALAKGAAAIVMWDVTDPASVVETPLVTPESGGAGSSSASSSSSFVANVNALVPLDPGYTHGVQGVQAYTVDGHVFVVTVTGEVRRDLAWLARRGFLGKHGIELPEDWRLAGGGRAAGARAEEAEADDDHENEGDNDGEGEEDGDEGEGGDLKVPGLDNKMVRYHGAAISKNGAITAVLYTIFPTNELIYRTERFTHTYIDLFLTPTLAPPSSSNLLSPLMTRLESALQDAALAIGTRALLWDVVYATNLHPDWKPIVLDAMHTWSAAAADSRVKRRVDQWMFMLHSAATKAKSPPTDTARNLSVELLVSHWLAAVTGGQQPALAVLRVCALVRSLAQEPFAGAARAAGLAELAHACARALSGEADVKICAWVGWLLAVAERFGGAAGGSVAMEEREIVAASELVLVDPCPVCGETADVVVDPDTMGLVSLCKNKHRITRCCLTLAVLATPKCRACTGCAKTKAVASNPGSASADNTCPMCADRLLWSGRLPLPLPPLPIPTLADPLPMGDSDSEPEATAAAAAKTHTPARRGRPPKPRPTATSAPPADASDDNGGAEDGGQTPLSRAQHRSAAKPKAPTEPLDLDKISRALEVERAKKGKRRATVGIPLDGDEAEAGGEVPVKKRNGRPPNNNKDQQGADGDEEEGDQAESVGATPTPTPTPKRRGRPPKNPAAAATSSATPAAAAAAAAAEPKRRGRQPKTPSAAAAASPETPRSSEPKRRGSPSTAKSTPAAAGAAADGQEMGDPAKEQEHTAQVSSTSAAAALMALASASPSTGAGGQHGEGDDQQGAVAPPETTSSGRGGRGRGRGGARGGSGTARGRGRGRGTTASVGSTTPTPAPTAGRTEGQAESGAGGAAGSESIEQVKDADGDVVMGDV